MYESQISPKVRKVGKVRKSEKKIKIERTLPTFGLSDFRTILVSLQIQLQQMVRKTFGIYSDDLSGCVLYIETGRDYIACWCKHAKTGIVKSFELFSFRENDINDFDKLLNEIHLQSRLLTSSFEKAYCIWGDEKCICVPREFYNDNVAVSYMHLIFGDEAGPPFYKDDLKELIVLSTLPDASAALASYHSVEANVHKYYQLLKGQQTTEPQNKLHVFFYHSHFIVSAFKDGMIQLIQNFAYRAPEDVLYYLLHISETYHLPLSETYVYASGMIDTSSPLYEMLRSYILHFVFEPVEKEKFEESFHEYPLHYFASFCQYDV
jgi:Protein of unknown function (DUF3822)